MDPLIIDYSSVLITSLVLTLAFIILSLFTWLESRRRIAGPGYWFAGFSMIAMGLALFSLEEAAPELISIVIANGFVMAGVMVKTFGFIRFLDARPRAVPAALFIVFAVSVALLYGFNEIDPNSDMAIVVTSLAYIGYGSVTAYFLLFRAPPELRAEARIAAILFFVYAAIYGFKIAYALGMTAGFIEMSETTDSMTLIAVITLLACIAIVEMQLMHGSLRISLKRAGEAMAVANHSLTDEILRRTEAESQLLAINRELSSTQKEIMITLSEVVEFRSKETARHVARVGEYARSLCAARGLSPEQVDLIADAAPMHDIGKISISDDILKKPSLLSEEEMAAMRGHTLVGYRLLDKSERPLIKMAALIALEHHEYWDGSGYPYGKAGEGISFAGRAVCLCDVFDALSSPRPYKEAWELPRILEYIRAERGRMFDPGLADSLFSCLDEFISIARTLKDEEAAYAPSR